MRTSVLVLFAIAAILGTPLPSPADQSASLVINGRKITEESPVIRDSRAFVPLRLVSEKLGAKVYWDPSQRTIDVANTHSEIRLFLNSPVAFHNARRFTLDTAPFLIGNRTYVPLRFVANGLGAAVHYDQSSRTVSISTSSHARVSAPGPNVREYYATSEDTLWTIAQKFNTTVQAIMKTNRLNSDLITPGQLLFIPTDGRAVNTASRSLPVGQARPGCGELLEWKYANWLFNHHSTAVIHDLWSGKRFRVFRIGGGLHADCEPLTAQDTAVMKSVYGGQWSWNTRPVIVEVEGRRLAASINGMPHGFDTLPDNGFNGMFCVHFWKSRNHNTGQENPNHQLNVQRAAGLK